MSKEYVSALMSAAVYEHADVYVRLPKLENIKAQLENSAAFLPTGDTLPQTFIDKLTPKEKTKYISLLNETIKDVQQTPHLDTLENLGWHAQEEENSAAFGIGNERGFYAVPFTLEETGETLIAFRGTSNTLNWLDNIRLFFGKNLWPRAITQLQSLAATGDIHPVDPAAYEADLELTAIAARYTQRVQQNAPIHGFTGHSLGGYLALMESIRCRLPAVTVDNPGVLHQLSVAEQQHCSNYLTELVSDSNAVNTIGRHPGQLICIPMRPSLPRYGVNLYLLDENLNTPGSLILNLDKCWDTLFFPQLLSTSNPNALSLRMDALKPFLLSIAGLTLFLALLDSSVQARSLSDFFGRFTIMALQRSGEIIQQASRYFIRSGHQHLGAYFDFLSSTGRSHDVAGIIQRGFTQTGAAQNHFAILRNNRGHYCWPSARPQAFRPQGTDDLALDYALTQGNVSGIYRYTDTGALTSYLERELLSEKTKQREITGELEQLNHMLRLASSIALKNRQQGNTHTYQDDLNRSVDASVSRNFKEKELQKVQEKIARYQSFLQYLRPPAETSAASNFLKKLHVRRSKKNIPQEENTSPTL